MAIPAFNKLHKKIQHALWDMNWTQLRAIQTEAIHYLNDETGDLVIAANTASGKTEAVFLPVLSFLADDFKGSIKALYIGPLKALINDQFRRLEDLCMRTEIPVYRWHGDVSASAKRRLIQKPTGVLLITPESIESLFINRSPHLSKLFGALEYIVIDEIHSFMGTERGIHLQSLLSRLQRFSRTIPRRIGLSATLGDMTAACDWLQAVADRQVEIIRGEGDRDLAVMIHGYLTRSPFNENEQAIAEDDLGDFFDIAKDIFKTFRGKTNLIFGNAKSQLELFTNLLAEISKNNRLPNEFLIHHGSLAKSIREDAEEQMRSGKPFTTFCTNTLELGIDIGYVDSIGQINPPFSVSALTQRVGRSGRKEGAAAKLRFFIREDEPDQQSPPWDCIYQDLLQAIAMIELLRKKWCESPLPGQLHYSTLAQQILSVLAQTGGIRADRLFELLIKGGAFAGITVEEYKELLRGIAQHDFIEQMPEGDLILGLAGQRIVNHYDFYSAFKSPEEYRVLNDGKPIGTLPLIYPIPVGEHLILAGKRWQVIARDDDKKEIVVVKARGAKPPFFVSGYGNIAPEIRKKMFAILFDENTPAYLNPTAREMFHQAKETANRLHLDRQCLHQFGPDTTVFTWTGTKINTTLRLTCETMGVKVSDFGIGLTIEKRKEKEVKQLFRVILENGLKQLNIPGNVEREFKVFEKYDEFLPAQLLDRAYENNHLDTDGATELISELLK